MDNTADHLSLFKSNLSFKGRFLERELIVLVLFQLQGWVWGARNRVVTVVAARKIRHHNPFFMADEISIPPGGDSKLAVFAGRWYPAAKQRTLTHKLHLPKPELITGWTDKSCNYFRGGKPHINSFYQISREKSTVCRKKLFPEILSSARFLFNVN